MDPKKKQLLTGIGIIAAALAGGFLVIKAIGLYTPDDFEANINQPQDGVEIPTEGNTENGNNPDAINPGEGEIQDSGTQADTISEDIVNVKGEITVIVPGRVASSEFSTLIKKIEASYGVKTNLKTIRTISEYQVVLRAALLHPEDADIILMPTNRIESFTQRGYHLSSQSSISTLFHPLFRDLINHESFTYFPYLLDPFVTLYNTESYTPTGKTTFSDLQAALITPRKETAGYLPLLFGFDAGDLALLEKGQVTYPGYLELLQLFLGMDVDAQSLTLLEFFNQTTYRNTTRFHALSTALGERVDSCQYWPQLCLLAYDIGDIGFGLLHEFVQLEEAFPNKRATIAFSNIPVLDDSYPVIGWGWMISKESQHLPIALTWLKGYLEILVNEEPTLNKATFSASNAIFQRQKIEDRYLSLAPFYNQFELVMGSITDGQKLIQKTPLLPMLRGEYSKGIFLKMITESN